MFFLECENSVFRVSKKSFFSVENCFFQASEKSWFLGGKYKNFFGGVEQFFWRECLVWLSVPGNCGLDYFTCSTSTMGKYLKSTPDKYLKSIQI